MKDEDVFIPSWLNVSRETLDQLFAFRSLVEKWNATINLVSKSGISTIWNRHILDSAQIFILAPQRIKLWCDLGSGGGFPGIIAAILAKELQPTMEMVLVEADRRKSVFLSESIRLLNLNAVVKPLRIEDLAAQNADVLSARALAPLQQLCSHAYLHLKPEGIALFPKGAAAHAEIESARKFWQFDCTETVSLTDPAARVLSLKGIRHA